MHYDVDTETNRRRREREHARPQPTQPGRALACKSGWGAVHSRCIVTKRLCFSHDMLTASQ